MIKGRELVLLGSLSILSIVIGGLGLYLAESGHPDANTRNIQDAFWQSIEIITTVAYGEYYPVTSVGRMVAGVTMFASIGFLWTFVGLIGTSLVTKRVREDNRRRWTRSTMADDTQELIKDRIDGLEHLSETD